MASGSVTNSAVESNKEGRRPEGAQSSHKQQLIPRTYQKALITIAKERNIIACLPTGAGKTLIALKLSDTYFEQVKANRRKIIFLACTLPLLKQQYELFQKHTNFQCNAFSGTGTETFDTSTAKTFQNKYKSCEVILTTPQYFYNLLTQGFIQFEDICLLILDECHHAVSGNPMNQIMRIYLELKENNVEYPLPRILGLSATVVVKNVSVEVLPDEIALVEKRLDCVAVSYGMLAEVLAHSTNAVPECIKYTLAEFNLSGYNENDFLAPIISTIRFFRTLPRDFKYDSQHKRLHPIVPSKWLFNGKALGDKVATLLEECCILSPMLGPFAIMHLAVVKIRHVQDKMKNITEKDECILKMYRVAKTALLNFLVRARSKFPEAFAGGHVEHLLSKKVLKLLDILVEYRDKAGTDECLCGLLFVSRRTIAIALKEILLHLRHTNPAKFDFIRPAVVIGANAKQKMSSADRVKATDQAEIIKRFRGKELNLLICTSVLEEGLDVPSCNVVIRFDGIQSFTSYVQSMGRARKQNAKYFVLLSDDEYEFGSSQVNKFGRVNHSLNQSLREHLSSLQNTASKIEDENEDEEFEDDEISTHIPDFCPAGNLGARVTAYTCVSLCYRYATAICVKKPIKCWNWYDEYKEVENLLTKIQYQASITLPPGSAVDNLIIQSQPMPNKKIAKKAAFMEACKRIYAGGGFDRNFLPRVPEPSNFELSLAISKLYV